ncbi:class I SAM-dependent methyltransferase [Alteribacter natronophilus]|uniref:class I SAM-dependent methyltransferase n=1 Tax=Alteribacter natronophilus TaxID=2583810 RepID=UPI001FE2D272|nr:methyltransferase domain-containing protein [Alteribacter natronophilus]
MTGTEFDERVDFFDRMARTAWLSTLHDKMIASAGKLEGKRIFDAGCGTGRLLARAAGKETKISGIDLSEGMIEACRNRLRAVCPDHRVELVIGDAEELPFQDRSFDVSFCACVLFLMPDPKQAFSELARVTEDTIVLLNPSEHLNLHSAEQYIKENALDGDEAAMLLQWGRVSERRHRFSEDRLSEMASSSGFSFRNQYLMDDLALLSVLSRT